jgi:hypothetical protein
MSLLTAADWLVIAGYFVVLYAVVLRHSAANRANPTEFFLAGRNAVWFIVGVFALLLRGWLFVPFYLRSEDLRDDCGRRHRFRSPHGYRLLDRRRHRRARDGQGSYSS